jgi:hypothetical protein
MKYVKILGLLAVAAAAMMAFAASASATTVTNAAGSSTPTIHAVNEEAHVELHNSIVNIKCQSTAAGTAPAATEGGTGQEVSGPLSSLTFTNCTNEWAIDIASNGSLSIAYKEAGGGTHGVGTLKSTGARVTATRAGLSCIYETNGTPIGTVTGGNPATLAISANIPRVGGSFLCGGSTAAWTGSYVTTETLKIDP